MTSCFVAYILLDLHFVEPSCTALRKQHQAVGSKHGFCHACTALCLGEAGGGGARIFVYDGEYLYDVPGLMFGRRADQSTG